MKSTVETLEVNTVKLTITVDKDEFGKAMQKSYLKNRRSISIPGFRKGKAPRKVIETHYGEAVFYDDAINEVCPKAYEEALEANEVVPVDQPEWDIENVTGGEELVFTAKVTIMPEVELGEYDGIEINKVEYNVTDEEVQTEINTKLEENARWLELEEGAIENGHRVTMDYDGKVDGEVFDGGSSEGYTLEIGSNQFIPGFEDQMIGLSIDDEEKEVKVTFPEDYQAEDLQSKDAVFSLKIHKVEMKELPELDDEFAQDVSEFDTLDEYRTSIKDDMEKKATDKADGEMRDAAVGAVSANSEVTIPEVMVEKEIDEILRNMEMQMRYQGLNLEQYIQFTGGSLDDLRQQQRDSAYDRVKTQLTLSEIGKVEEIEVTDEDLEAEYKTMAEAYGREVDEIKKQFEAGAEGLKDSLKARKTIEFIVENAVMVESDDVQVEDVEAELIEAETDADEVDSEE